MTTHPLAFISEALQMLGPYWVIFILIAVVVLIMTLMLKNPDAHTSRANSTSDSQPPEVWDEQEISARAHHLSEINPSALPLFINGVRQRFIDGQNILTVRRRTVWIQSLTSALEAEYKARKAAGKIRRIEDEEELEGLSLEAAKERAHLDAAQAKLQRENLYKPPPEQPQPAQKKTREQKRADIEANIARLRREKDNLRAEPDTHERKRMENALENRLERLREELTQFL
jgi:hypothetical protein